MNVLPPVPSRLELWGGVECTVNRVGDRYFDQLELTGHDRRLDDLDLFADLGIKALRYPVLWERTAPQGLDTADWSWSDERLARLRGLGIRPIAGLVHHGSGPRSTSLIDPDFPAKLAQYARAVAERYPWLDAYTPINEPLTTARFSGLYGLWYPHGRDDRTFARVLLAECRAVVLAMQAIRAVNPSAQLIQTDDLGKTWSTPLLAYQADFENERRWLAFDLLHGRVDQHHPLWSYLRLSGVDESELTWFLDHPCPPDIMGINHYLSGERFLDERVELYPDTPAFGNGQHRYVDVLALRVRAAGVAGPRILLREAWQRYGTPIAVTEAHNGCTREEQLRWLAEIWQAGQALRAEGVDLRAVTVWSLLGCFDWDSLVTSGAGHYEPGVFDLRGPRPRPTALTRTIRALATDRIDDHPVLDTPGWWRRSTRLTYGFALDNDGLRQAVPVSPAMSTSVPTAARTLLITGATGTLGQAFARICEMRGLAYRLLTRREMDITEPVAIDAMLNQMRPWAVINTAGAVRVDDLEYDSQTCHRANADGPALLAIACAERGIPLLTFSSDLVFDGAKRTPYIERDAVAPLNVYGRSKAEAERRVLQALPQALVVRTSAFFGPWDAYNFVTTTIGSLAARLPVVAADDAVISPTYVPDLVHACLDLLIDGECGIWHLANDGAMTWAELARRAAQLAGLDASGVVARPTETLDLAAPRPCYSVLGSERGMLLPPLEHALDRYMRERDDVLMLQAMER